MKIIATLINVVLSLVLFAAIGFGAYVAGVNYYQAKLYSELSDMDRTGLFIVDNHQYNKLKDSYELVKDVPLIGDTL